MATRWVLARLNIRFLAGGQLLLGFSRRFLARLGRRLLTRLQRRVLTGLGRWLHTRFCKRQKVSE
jgi:hypothetical protein